MEFSVLISIYYKESSVDFKRALHSVLDNTVKPFEIVVVKDGKLTLELDAVLDEFVESHPSLFKVIALEHNLGLGQALNIGLHHCKCDLVARMDADDICDINRFKKQLSFMAVNPNISVLGGSIAEFRYDPLIIDSYRILPNTNQEISQFLKYRNPFNHMTVMYRKKDVITSNNYQDFYYLEDYYLWLRMYLNGFEFANLKDVLVKAKTGKDMLSRRGGRRYVQSEFKLLSFMRSKKIINIFEYLFLLSTKTVLRLTGPKVRRIVYKFLLRKRMDDLNY